MHLADEETPPEPLPPVYDGLIARVLAGEIKAGDIDTPTATHMAEQFTKAAFQGAAPEMLNPDIIKTISRGTGFDYSTPDHKLLANLQKSCYQFSGAKSWHMNKALTELLVDENGQKRSPSQFEKVAREKLGIYANQYQAIEVKAAGASGLMAAKEQRFRENANIMPWLIFKTSRGEHVCPICGKFNNLVAHIDDPVWEYATPLLHYGCACTKLQLPGTKETPTPADQVPPPETVPPLFRKNYAAKMQAFPPDHPYYTEVPRRSLTAWARENIPKPEKLK